MSLMRPGIGPGSNGSNTPIACKQLDSHISSNSEAKLWFLGEGGVLVLLEVLDSDNEENAAAAIALMTSMTKDDLRLLGR